MSNIDDSKMDCGRGEVTLSVSDPSARVLFDALNEINSWLVSGFTGTSEEMRQRFKDMQSLAVEALTLASRIASESHLNQETMTLHEVWVAAGGNPGIVPSKADVLCALKLLDEVCDEADSDSHDPGM